MMKFATESFEAVERRHDATVEQFLGNAFCELPHIDSLFLFAPNGETVFSSEETNCHTDLPALADSIWQSAQNAVGALKRDKLNYLALQTPGGFIVATRLQPGHILILLGCLEVRLGLLLYEMETLARRLELTLAEGSGAERHFKVDSAQKEQSNMVHGNGTAHEKKIRERSIP